MTSEQVPAEDLTNTRIDVALGNVAIAFAQLTEQITELRRSLRREENARKVLAETNQRLAEEIKRLGGGPYRVPIEFRE